MASYTGCNFKTPLWEIHNMYFSFSWVSFTFPLPYWSRFDLCLPVFAISLRYFFLLFLSAISLCYFFALFHSAIALHYFLSYFFGLFLCSMLTKGALIHGGSYHTQICPQHNICHWVSGQRTLLISTFPSHLSHRQDGCQRVGQFSGLSWWEPWLLLDSLCGLFRG